MGKGKEHYKSWQKMYGFTDHEIERLRYGLSVIASEGSKLILMTILFVVLGKFELYAIAVVTLLPIRIFSGGLHFNHYISCLLFTTSFFVLCVFLSTHLYLSQQCQSIINGICLFITFFTGPVTSKKRPPLSHRQYNMYRLISSGLLFIYVVCFIVADTFPHRNLCFHVITLQTIQLVCARLARKGEKYEKG